MAVVTNLLGPNPDQIHHSREEHVYNWAVPESSHLDALVLRIELAPDCEDHWEAQYAHHSPDSDPKKQQVNYRHCYPYPDNVSQAEDRSRQLFVVGVEPAGLPL